MGNGVFYFYAACGWKAAVELHWLIKGTSFFPLCFFSVDENVETG